MHYIANSFADRLKPRFGFATVTPAFGESFDVNNDLTLCQDGVIRSRHAWQGAPIDIAQYGGRVIAACADALLAYNRATMDSRAFAYHYGDDPTESGFGD